MDVLDEVQRVLEEAAAAADPRVGVSEALEVLAGAVVAGRPVDPERLMRVAVAFDTSMGAREARAGFSAETLMAKGRFSGACREFRDSGRVSLGDGRVATAAGWSRAGRGPTLVEKGR